MVWFNVIFGFLVLLHLVCCFLIYLGIEMGLVKVRKLMFFVALFMPFWGELLVLILHFQVFIGHVDISDVGVEKFKVESELYKSVRQDETMGAKTTVSIEEALIVNTPKERRALIMDILNDNPKAYVEFLKLAGNNDDTEVVHYAVSAMVQISKENDQTLWELEQKYQQDPDNLENLSVYCDFLWHCLEQGLMQGQVEQMNRNLFDTLIQKKIRLVPPQLSDYLRCIQNSLSLKNYTAAATVLENARKIWPESEELLILQIQYLADLQRGEELHAFLRSLEEKNIYLTAKAKEVVAFWSD